MFIYVYQGMDILMSKGLADHVPKENAFICANGENSDQPVYLQ